MAKEGQGKDMAQQSARQDRENQHAPKCSKHAALIWTRSRYSHTGQRHANGRIKGRIHDCTRRALHDPKSYLRQRGCPYMVHRYPLNGMGTAICKVAEYPHAVQVS